MFELLLGLLESWTVAHSHKRLDRVIAATRSRLGRPAHRLRLWRP
jgi:hypothetical protein